MARTQFTFTFTNAQPGADVGFNFPAFADSSTTVADGTLVLDSTNSVSVWADAAYLIAHTVDGRGVQILGVATSAYPTQTIDAGVPGPNPFPSGGSTPVDLLSLQCNIPGAITAGGVYNVPFDTVAQQVGTALGQGSGATLIDMAAGLYLVAITVTGPLTDAPTGIQVSYAAPGGSPPGILPYATGDPWLPVVQKDATDVEIAGSQAFFAQGSDPVVGGVALQLSTYGNATPWTPAYIGMEYRKIA